MNLIKREDALALLQQQKTDALENGRTIKLRAIKRKIRDVESLPEGTDLIRESLAIEGQAIVGVHSPEQQQQMAVDLIRSGRDYVMLVLGGEGKMDSIITTLNKRNSLAALVMACLMLDKEA